jgi:hypothetical protein
MAADDSTKLPAKTDFVQAAAPSIEGVEGLSIDKAPDYNDPRLDPRLKAAMDSILQGIDFEDPATISGLASHEVRELGAVADQLGMDRFDQLTEDVSKALKDLTGIDGLGELVTAARKQAEKFVDVIKRNPAEAASIAFGTLIGQPLLGVLGAAGIKAFRKYKPQKGDEKKSIKELLRDECEKIPSLERALKDADKELTSMTGNLKTLGQARIKLLLSLNVYMGAIKEASRRLDTELAAAKKDYESQTEPSAKSLAKQKYEMLDLASKKLESRGVTLTTIRTQQVIMTEMIQQMMKNVVSLSDHVKTNLESNIPLLKAIAVQGEMLVSQMEIAELNKEVAQKAEKMLDFMVKLENDLAVMIANRDDEELKSLEHTLAALKTLKTNMASRLAQQDTITGVKRQKTETVRKALETETDGLAVNVSVTV